MLQLLLITTTPWQGWGECTPAYASTLWIPMLQQRTADILWKYKRAYYYYIAYEVARGAAVGRGVAYI